MRTIYRAGGFLNDLLDQREGVLGALAEPDQRDVGPLSRCHRPDVVDLDLGAFTSWPRPATIGATSASRSFRSLRSARADALSRGSSSVAPRNAEV
jgi:hypothetical protein